MSLTKTCVMDFQTLERNIRFSNRRPVLDHPVGLDIYLFNPYRLCNISPDHDWKNSGKQLRQSYDRFLAFSRINKLEKEPIGPGAEMLFNLDLSSELKAIKNSAQKANSRLAWKIFWLNGLQEQYDSIPRNLGDIPIEGLSDHNIAVLYHFQAILNTLELLENPKADFQPHLWVKALEYWGRSLEDEDFWSEIEKVLKQEAAAGNFELKDYDVGKVKREVTEAVYNTVITIPLKLIEQDTSAEQKNKWVSQFLRIILNAPLGDEKTRNRYAKQLIENRISKEVIRASKNMNFQKWADKGNYRQLYDRGMAYLDKIKGTTQQIFTEAEDSRLHSSVFLSEVVRVPEIHTRVAAPLIKAVCSNGIFENQDLDKDRMEKTVFTMLILALRMLTELNVDRPSVLQLQKNVEGFNERYRFGQLSKGEIAELNRVALPLEEVRNPEVAQRYYLAQYCYFIPGEFADPDETIFKKFEKEVGMWTKFFTTAIPASSLAGKFFRGDVDNNSIENQRRRSNYSKIREEKWLHEARIEALENERQKLAKKIQPVEEMVLKTKQSAKKALDRVEHKIEQAIKQEIDQSTEYRQLTQRQEELTEAIKNKESQLKQIPDLNALYFSDKEGGGNTFGCLILFIAGLAGFISNSWVVSIITFIGLPILFSIASGILNTFRSRIKNRLEPLAQEQSLLQSRITPWLEDKKAEVRKKYQSGLDQIKQNRQESINRLEGQIEEECLELAKLNDEFLKVRHKVDALSCINEFKQKSAERQHPVVQHFS